MDIAGFAGEEVAQKYLDQSAALEFMKHIYPKFRKQYNWFKETQWGEIEAYSSKLELGFRWRGKKGVHVLTSGLDDYPRAPGSHTEELHLDLLCWVAFYAKTMKTLANHLKIVEDLEMYEHDYESMMKTLDEVHWDSASEAYADVSYDEHGKEFLMQARKYIMYLKATLPSCRLL
jgi:mannosyl-oligosaccharide glucosidase